MTAALTEIKYALDELKADGIGLASSYGLGSESSKTSLFIINFLSARPDFSLAYIGHDRYDAMWQELDKRQAVVFIHGSQLPGSAPYPDPYLGIPVSEVCCRPIPT